MNASVNPPHQPPVDPSADVIRRLKSARFFAKSMTAHAIAEELSDEDLVALNQDAKTELLDCLFQRMFFYPSKRQVARVMESFLLEHQPTVWQKNVTENLLKFITDTPAIKQARASWPHLSDRKRLNVLRQIARAHDRLGGFSSAGITGFRQPGRGYGDDKQILQGYHQPRHNQIGINFHADALGDDFDVVVGVLVHENTHNHQRQIARKYRWGLLRDTTPEAPLARLFAINHKLTEELLGTQIYELYYHQPIEQHARALGHGMTRALTRQRALDALKIGPAGQLPADQLIESTHVPQLHLALPPRGFR